MTEEQSSYRQIMKATSLLGGVQIFNIVINIARSKLIAVLLGPAGMGIAGLLNSTLGLIQGLTNFGLGTSAVKNVAEAKATGNKTRIAIVITTLRRLVWLTGILGTLCTIILSPLLSELAFNNTEYTLAFVWISVTLLLKQITAGQLVLLQGLRKLKFLANANLLGSLSGLVISIPLYYFWGLKAIPIAIIITAISALVIAYFFSRKTKIHKVRVSKVRTIAEGKNMLTMGFMLSLSSLITSGVAYIIRIFISNRGGISEVGLYNAGFAIINTYAGLVFTAMATDYYPRLSETANNNILSKQKINQQAEIAILILGPVITIFLVFIKWIVIILYSDKFIAVDGMIHWAALGMLFKAVSWSVSFIFLAKGASRFFFTNELLANSYTLILNLLGYYYYGLTGLGISFLIGYLLYLIQVFLFTRKKYNFKFGVSLKKIFLIQLLLCLVCFITVKTLDSFLSYLIGGFFILISLGHSTIELNRKLGLKKVFQDIMNKLRR